MHTPLKRLIVVLLILFVVSQLILASIDVDAPFADALTAARIKVKLGKSAEALTLLERYTEVHPDRPKGFLALGDLLVAMPIDGALTRANRAYLAAAFGVHAAPITTAEEHLTATTGAVSADSLVALRQAGLLAGLRGKPGEATEDLNQAVAGGDESALRILALSAVGRGLPTGNGLLQAAIIKSPSDAALLLNVAALWAGSTHPDQAQRYLNQLGDRPEARPDADSWTQYGAARLYALQGDDARAAACLAAIPHHVDAAHLDRALPFTRQEVADDPAFRDAGAQLRGVIAQWPRTSPWADRS